jgi:hypothetical protein
MIASRGIAAGLTLFSKAWSLSVAGRFWFKVLSLLSGERVEVLSCATTVT